MQNRDEITMFCVDYRAVNRLMNADRFPLLMIDEVLEYMSGEKVYRKLDMFAGF